MTAYFSSGLRETILRLQEKLDRPRSDLRRAEKDNIALREAAVAAAARLEDLNDSVQTLQDEKRSSTEQHAAAIDALRAEFEAELGESFARHKEIIHERDASIATLERERINRQGVINQSQLTIHTLREERETLNETIDDLREQNKNLRGTITEDTEIISNLRANVSTLNQTIGTNVASLTTLQADKTRLEERNTKLAAEIKDMDRMIQRIAERKNQR